MTKQLVRITGRNGVIYEEWMTEGQLTQFLRLTETRMSVGVAFDEWEITITEASEQTLGEQEIARSLNCCRVAAPDQAPVLTDTEGDCLLQADAGKGVPGCPLVTCFRSWLARLCT